MSGEGVVEPLPAAVMEPLDEIGAEEPTESKPVSSDIFYSCGGYNNCLVVNNFT